MSDSELFAVTQAVIAKYGWLFIGINMFWPAYRDFVEGFMMGLLGA